MNSLKYVAASVAFCGATVLALYDKPGWDFLAFAGLVVPFIWSDN